MAISVGDVIQLTDVQAFLGQQVLNVYYYRIVSKEPLADYADLGEAFDNVVRSQVLLAQHTGCVHPMIQMKNLTNGLDIYDHLDSQAGSRTSDPLASFYAGSFRLNRATALTRHGAKRIAGFTEDMVVGNAISTSGVNDLMNLIAGAMASDIAREGTVDHDIVAEPVIVGRVPGTGPGAGELDLTRINPVAGAQFIRLSTQTTRRAGRGA